MTNNIYEIVIWLDSKQIFKPLDTVNKYKDFLQMYSKQIVKVVTYGMTQQTKEEKSFYISYYININEKDINAAIQSVDSQVDVLNCTAIKIADPDKINLYNKTAAEPSEQKKIVDVFDLIYNLNESKNNNIKSKCEQPNGYKIVLYCDPHITDKDLDDILRLLRSLSAKFKRGIYIDDKGLVEVGYESHIKAHYIAVTYKADPDDVNLIHHVLVNNKNIFEYLFHEIEIPDLLLARLD